MVDWEAVRRRLAEEHQRQREILKCEKSRRKRIDEGIERRKAGLGAFNVQHYPGHEAPRDEEEE